MELVCSSCYETAECVAESSEELIELYILEEGSEAHCEWCNGFEPRV